MVGTICEKASSCEGATNEPSQALTWNCESNVGRGPIRKEIKLIFVFFYFVFYCFSENKVLK